MDDHIWAVLIRDFGFREFFGRDHDDDHAEPCGTRAYDITLEIVTHIHTTGGFDPSNTRGFQVNGRIGFSIATRLISP